MVKFLKTKAYPVANPVWEMPANAGIDGFTPSNTDAFRAAFSEKNPEVAFVSKPDREMESSYYDTTAGWIYVAPGEDVLIPSGLYMQIPEGVALIDMNKSGIATKKKLATGACVIDFSYQGIIHYHVFNFSKKKWTIIKCDEKIMQMLPVLVDTSGAQVEEDIDPADWFKEKSARGAGGFGSTGLGVTPPTAAEGTGAAE